MQQFRLGAAQVSFICFGCHRPKQLKVLTVYNGDWNRRLCNDCYGRLLSVYDIKAGTEPNDAKAEELATVLLSRTQGWSDDYLEHELNIWPSSTDFPPSYQTLTLILKATTSIRYPAAHVDSLTPLSAQYVAEKSRGN